MSVGLQLQAWLDPSAGWGWSGIGVLSTVCWVCPPLLGFPSQVRFPRVAESWCQQLLGYLLITSAARARRGPLSPEISGDGTASNGPPLRLIPLPEMIAVALPAVGRILCSRRRRDCCM